MWTVTRRWGHHPSAFPGCLPSALGSFRQPGPPCRDGISLGGHFELFLSGMFHLPIPRWTLLAPLFMGKATQQLLASSPGVYRLVG